MKQALMALSLIAALAKPATAEEWFVAHIHQDPCVPLSDMGDNLERLYYGAGSMRTPEDFVAHIRSLGVSISAYPMPGGSTHARVYTLGDHPGVSPRVVMLFNDHALCERAISLVTK